ncbi:MAG TPA: SDR family oxidoreductase [Acidimicrobiales bacterium]|nr:SDR family oxidoreductase [Acidimicrobiales bacterium]
MSADGHRTVLTTGANSGVGLATVVHLARLGYRSVGSVRSKAKATPVIEAATRASVTVETVILDVTNAERCRVVVDRLRPWALVNNAGYAGVGAIEDVTDSEARQQLETMVVAPMRLARLALPYMRANGQGRVVNVSSIYGLTTTPFSGWYQASKHALEAASDALRVEIARDGIKVILIEPGGVRTHIWKEMEVELASRVGSSYETQYRRALTLLAPYMALMADPEAVARVIGKALTTTSPRARYLVGWDAQGIAAAQGLIPTGVRDRITRLFAGL